MAPKAQEPTLRDIMKVVSELTSKISALESLIVDQKVIILNQAEDIKIIKAATAGKPEKINEATCFTSESTPTAPPPVTRRPVRNARANAALRNTCTVATQKIDGKRRPSLTEHTTTPVITGHETRPKAHHVVVTTESNATSLAGKRSVTPKKSTENVGDEWKTISKKSSRKRRIIAGTGKEDNDIQTVERLKYIQAWHFKPETTKQNVLNYINKVAQCEEYYVEKRQTKSNWHAVFVIGIPERLYQLFSSPTSWPQGVCVSDWIFRAQASIIRDSN